MRNNPPLSIVSKSLLVTVVLAASCWLCYRPTPAVAQSTATPLLYNMAQLWHWGGLIDTMRPVGDFLYMGMGRHFVIFDISKPAIPQRLGVLSIGVRFDDIEIIGDYALIAAGEDGLFTVDIHDKHAPRLVAERHDPYAVRSIAVLGRYAYIAYIDTDPKVGSGVEILDITDPVAPLVLNPQLAGLAFDPIDLQITDNHLFVAGGHFETVSLTYRTWGALQAFDLTEPTAPLALPAYQTPSVLGIDRRFYTLRLLGNDAYVAQGDSLYRFAINTPANITLRSTLSLSALKSTTLTVVGNQLYVANYSLNYEQGGIYVLDVSTSPTITVRNYLPQPVGAMTAQDNIVFVGRYDDGLHLLDGAQPVAPIEIGAYRTLASLGTVHLVAHNQFLYVTGGRFDTPLLSTIDLQDPTQPTLATIITASDTIAAYPVVDDPWLILAAESPDADLFDNFQLFDLTRPATPQRVVRQETAPFTNAVYANHHLYLEHKSLAPLSSYVRIFDLATPTAPQEYGFLIPTAPTLRYGQTISANTNYLYYVGFAKEKEPRRSDPYYLYVYDLAIDENRAKFQLPVPLYNIGFHANTIYGVARTPCQRSIYLIDVSTPTSPFIRQSYCWGWEVEDLLFDGNLLYIADRGGGYSELNGTALSVIDFTVPHAPKLAGYAREATSAYPQLTQLDDTIYLLSNGLSAYRYTPPQAAAQLTAGGVLTVPVDAITYTFPSTAFAEPVVVTHTTRYVDPWLAFSAPWVGIGNAFALTSTAPTTGAFVLTIGYPAEAAQLGEVATLALYRWADGAWVAEPSVVDPATQTVTATPTTTGVWMLRALARNRLYLPVIHHTQP